MIIKRYIIKFVVRALALIFHDYIYRLASQIGDSEDFSPLYETLREHYKPLIIYAVLLTNYELQT